MRAWHLGAVGVVGVVVLSLTGCPGGSGDGDGSKLKEAIVGKWEGKSW
jgi:hypothetical protein